MTVRELIEALSKEPPEAEVYRRYYAETTEIVAVVHDADGAIVVE